MQPIVVPVRHGRYSYRQQHARTTPAPRHTTAPHSTTAPPKGPPRDRDPHPDELRRARRTGALVGDILHELSGRARVGTNLLEIDRWAREMILEAGATSCYVDYAPSFGRGPFGHYICTAVNDAVLHGLPTTTRWPTETC